MKDKHIKYQTLDNVKYLESPFYYKEVLPKEEKKIHGNLFTKLRPQKLEDALLYEIAFRYLQLYEIIPLKKLKKK